MKMHRIISGIILLCFSAFLGHNLVPHHHHAEVFNSPVATECPFDHDDHHGHKHDRNVDKEKQPTHCHAFNDVVFEKYNTPALRPLTCSVQVMMIPGQIKLPESEQLTFSRTFIVLKLPCKTAAHLGSRDLRAPPVCA